MSDSVEDNYLLRLIHLMIEEGTETLRDLFYSKISKKDIKTFLSAPQCTRELELLRKKRVLSQKQYLLVTDENPKIDDFDISLLVTLLLNTSLFGKWPTTNMSTGAEVDITCIRDIRNEIVAHRTNTSMDLCEFKAFWGKIEGALVRIARSISPEAEKKIQQRIRNAEMRTLKTCQHHEPKVSNEFLQSHSKDVEQYPKWEEMQNSITSLDEKVSDRLNTMGDVMKDICEMMKLLQQQQLQQQLSEDRSSMNELAQAAGNTCVRSTSEEDKTVAVAYDRDKSPVVQEKGMNSPSVYGAAGAVNVFGGNVHFAGPININSYQDRPGQVMIEENTQINQTLPSLAQASQDTSPQGRSEVKNPAIKSDDENKNSCCIQ